MADITKSAARSPREAFAQAIVAQYQRNLPKQISDAHGVFKAVPHLKDFPFDEPMGPEVVPKKLRIGIIGAGAAGLYAGLMLETFRKEKGLDVEFEILEAEPVSNPPRAEDHPYGGRMWTHRFPKLNGDDNPQENDYYDRGAMRYPEQPFMEPLFALFETLGIKKRSEENPDGQLIPYYLGLDNNIRLFNNRPPMTKKEVEKGCESPPYDPFDTKVPELTGPSDEMVMEQISNIRNALKPQAGQHDISKKAWRWIAGKGGIDEWSTRGFMNLRGADGIGKYSGQVTNYLESIESSSTQYDQAFSETVLDSLEFDYQPNIKWWCIQGGAGVLAKAMKDKIPSENLVNGARVVRIEPQDKNDFRKGLTVSHTDPRGAQHPLCTKKYDHVISTVPFGCLSHIDTTKLDFSWELSSAIRLLAYGGSTKVAIRFKTRWWENEHLAHGAQKGGVSTTDRPSRMIIYPSYGIDQDKGASMIVSYTWQQDGTRLGALCRGRDNAIEREVLLRIVLEDLAAVHELPYDFLKEQVLDYDTYNWTDAPNACGAFALFGPGQFRDLYPRVTVPHRGVFHFAGEATSVHHAWVVGALNSAWRAVTEIGIHDGLHEEIVHPALHQWPEIKEFDVRHLHKQVWLGRNGVNTQQGYSDVNTWNL